MMLPMAVVSVVAGADVAAASPAAAVVAAAAIPAEVGCRGEVIPEATVVGAVSVVIAEVVASEEHAEPAATVALEPRAVSAALAPLLGKVAAGQEPAHEAVP